MQFTIDGMDCTAVYGGPERELQGCNYKGEFMACEWCELPKRCPAHGRDVEE